MLYPLWKLGNDRFPWNWPFDFCKISRGLKKKKTLSELLFCFFCQTDLDPPWRKFLDPLMWAQTARGQLDLQFLAQDFQIEEGGSQDFLIQNVSGSTDNRTSEWRCACLWLGCVYTCLDWTASASPFPILEVGWGMPVTAQRLDDPLSLYTVSSRQQTVILMRWLLRADHWCKPWIEVDQAPSPDVTGAEDKNPQADPKYFPFGITSLVAGVIQ